MKDIKNAFLAKQSSKTVHEGHRMRRVYALFGVKPLLHWEFAVSEWEPLGFDPIISKKNLITDCHMHVSRFFSMIRHEMKKVQLEYFQRACHALFLTQVERDQSN